MHGSQQKEPDTKAVAKGVEDWRCPSCDRELEAVVIYNHTIMRCPNVAVQHPPIIYIPSLATR